jgi:ssDNA-binding Zn-finger/Zn-ribbon topoisomerase 1
MRALVVRFFFQFFLYFVSEAMMPQQDHHCPKCKKNTTVLKGERKTTDGSRMFELLLACVSCGHEEWQKVSEYRAIGE